MSVISPHYFYDSHWLKDVGGKSYLKETYLFGGKNSCFLFSQAKLFTQTVGFLDIIKWLDAISCPRDFLLVASIEFDDFARKTR